MSAAEQVFAVLETPLPARGRRTDVPDPALTGISVEQLRVAYPGRGGPALDRVSLTVEPGEILAITGPSGYGKSTLLSVLLGFVAPQGGSVRVGDIELADLDPDAWRERVSWMSQRPHVFAASIADNVRLGRPDATVAQIWAAVEAAGLGDVVAGRPAGLETALSDRGSGLSVGERQRVALARAFLRDSPLLLLDEPTANLDGATEDEVLAALERLVCGRTVVLVAHRPALVDIADRVIDLGALRAHGSSVEGALRAHGSSVEGALRAHGSSVEASSGNDDFGAELPVRSPGGDSIGSSVEASSGNDDAGAELPVGSA
jgi:ABC-type multidrug transport system fused ATPase/permease subunit